MKAKQHIGTVTAERRVTVEEGMVRRYVDALELEDPLSTDPEAAEEAGLRGLMLPIYGATSLGDYASAERTLQVKPKQILHSKETITVVEPLCVGDVLDVTTTIADVFEQASGGNPMGVACIQVEAHDLDGDLVFEAQRWLVVRGGFPRR